MSTHCGIAIKTEKGIEGIYCHHDGYPEYMWDMLTTNYASEELAKKLVSLGDASYIAEKVEPDKGSAHSFENPDVSVSCFYHRDRGERWDQVAPIPYRSIQEFTGCFYYSYIWEDGCWHFYKDKEELY